jgi:hypothetical protein
MGQDMQRSAVAIHMRIVRFSFRSGIASLLSVRSDGPSPVAARHRGKHPEFGRETTQR